MREIKFRAWDKTQKYMYPDSNLGQFFTAYDEYNDGDWELMQYTGLHDKNGKEVYEGDILHEFRDKTALMANNGVDRILVVEDIRELDFYYKDCEVIGNIYENPEMMEGGTDD